MTRERERLRILYEDGRGAGGGFPLHRLVVATASDLCEGIERRVLESRVTEIPLRGRDPVLAELRHAERHLRYGVKLLVWLDNDHIREAFPNASPTSSNEEIVKLVKAKANVSDLARIDVFLLERNLESLLERLEEELVIELDSKIVHKAINKKGSHKVESRDICLLHIANNPRLRELLRGRHEGFDWVTRHVAQIATVEPWPFHGPPNDG